MWSKIIKIVEKVKEIDVAAACKYEKLKNVGQKKVTGTSCGKLYQELGLESLQSRRWYKRLSRMFKIMKKGAPNYFINLIPKNVRQPLEQKITIFQLAIVERTVSGIIFHSSKSE